MVPICPLVSFIVMQALEISGGRVVEAVQRHFTDHGRAIQRALVRANDSAWKSLSMALAGQSFLERVEGFFANHDKKGMATQIQEFLTQNGDAFPGTALDFRKICLEELRKAKKAGLLSAEKVTAREVVDQSSHFERYTDPQGLIVGAHLAVSQVADTLAKSFPNLAVLLRMPTPKGPPLLAVAFSFFFNREVESDADLARKLMSDTLQRLYESQQAAFERIDAVLVELGSEFDRVLGGLGRIENKVDELHQKVDQLLQKNNMSQGEIKPQHSFSIRSEDERQVVKALLTQFRELSPEDQRELPELLNKLGKLQYGSGDFQGAADTFEEAAQNANDVLVKAEAHYNAYRAAIEEKDWKTALEEIILAVHINGERFAPFDLSCYQPQQILGAGGFGTAFLCRDVVRGEQAVVKAFHPDVMERGSDDVFREAAVLQILDHPAIIKVLGWGNVNPVQRERPYIVMEYFPGATLDTWVRERGPFSPQDVRFLARQIAQGMQAAHQKGILHRDLKPANLLVRRTKSGWAVKIIDFGLALQRGVLETSRRMQTLGTKTSLAESGVGTLEYSAPEQLGFTSDEKIGKHSDVYSFGKVLCFALFGISNPNDRYWKKSQDHGNWKQLVQECTDHEVRYRIPSFEKVLEDLPRTVRGPQPPKLPDQVGRKSVEVVREPDVVVLSPEELRAEQERKRREEQRKRLTQDRKEAAERELRRLEQERHDRERRLAAERERQRREQERERRLTAERERRLTQERRQREQLGQLRLEGQRRLPGFLRAIFERTRGHPTKQEFEELKGFQRKFNLPKETMEHAYAKAREQWKKNNPPAPKMPGCVTVLMVLFLIVVCTCIWFVLIS
ncbi:MAG: protein kinase [Gemmataceae bacterium]